jgi:hypothetical protein
MNPPPQTSQPNSGNRFRVYVSSATSALIFAIAVTQLLSHAPWGTEAENRITAFWQTAVAPSQLDTTAAFSIWTLRAAFVVLCFYLVRLYMSLTVFDVLPENFQEYIKPLHRFFRWVEWCIRLLVFGYLLAGLPGYSFIVGYIRSATNAVSIQLPLGLPGSDDFCDISTYLCGLFLIFLGWDLWLIFAAWFSPGQVKLMSQKVFSNFAVEHLIGFGIWASFFVIFSNKEFANSAVVFFPVVAGVCMIVFVWRTFRSLFGTRRLLHNFVIAMKVEC